MRLFSRPLLFFCLAYFAGIICAVQTRINPLSGFFVVFLSLPLFILPIKPSSKLLVFVLACTFAVGLMRVSVYRKILADDVSHLAKDKFVTLYGSVDSDPEPTEEGATFVMRVSKVKTYTGEYPASGLVAVNLYRSPDAKSSTAAPFYGDALSVRGRLRQLSPERSGYAAHLARRQIYCETSASTQAVHVMESKRRGVKAFAATVKSAVERKAHELLPPVHADLLIGLLLGNAGALPASIVDAFKRAGAIHLLIASGWNVAALVLALSLLLNRLTVPRTATNLLLIGATWFYAVMTGCGPCIMRASLVVTLVLTAYLVRRTLDTINLLLAAAIIVLALNPLMLYDSGFQLSFAAVAAMVLILPLVEPKLADYLSLPRRRHAWVHAFERAVLGGSRVIVMTCVASAAILIGVWPILAYYFYYVPFVCIAANVFTALLVLGYTVVGSFAIGVGFIVPAAGHWIAGFGSWLASAILGVITALSRMPGASVSVGAPSPVVIAVYYLALLGVLEIAYENASGKSIVAPGP
jgi:competence protein ComEC